MATAAWKRPSSPIGKKGPRKAHPKYKRHAREPWESREIRELKSLAKGNTPTREGRLPPFVARPSAKASHFAR